MADNYYSLQYTGDVIADKLDLIDGNKSLTTISQAAADAAADAAEALAATENINNNITAAVNNALADQNIPTIYYGSGPEASVGKDGDLYIVIAN